jgi:hypothetical protein
VWYGCADSTLERVLMNQSSLQYKKRLGCKPGYLSMNLQRWVLHLSTTTTILSNAVLTLPVKSLDKGGGVVLGLVSQQLF